MCCHLSLSHLLVYYYVQIHIQFHMNKWVTYHQYSELYWFHFFSEINTSKPHANL